jgi:hypothetical protein
VVNESLQFIQDTNLYLHGLYLLILLLLLLLLLFL